MAGIVRQRELQNVSIAFGNFYAAKNVNVKIGAGECLFHLHRSQTNGQNHRYPKKWIVARRNQGSYNQNQSQKIEPSQGQPSENWFLFNRRPGYGIENRRQ